MLPALHPRCRNDENLLAKFNKPIILLACAGFAAAFAFAPALLHGISLLQQPPAHSSDGATICPWTGADRKTWRPMHLPDPGIPRTELMSFPGSGNSWVREIIETLTGFTTNSIYHCSGNYPPETAADCGKWNTSIVVKTHKFDCSAGWSKAIVLMRNPLHAIRAEYQRGVLWNQTAVIAAEQWDWQHWYHALALKCKRWVRDYATVLGDAQNLTNKGCAKLQNLETHVFFYEDIKTAAGDLNPAFLDALVSVLGVDQRNLYYNCTLAHPDGRYKREYPQDDDHPVKRLLTDITTQNILARAGCMEAYNAYRAALPRLPAGSPARVASTLPPT